MQGPRLLRIATIPASIHFLLHGQLAFMRSQGFTVFAASSGGDDVKQIEQSGIRHFVVPFTRTISPIRDGLCLLRLVWLIIKLKPDIVHTHTPKAGLLGMVAAWLCGVKLRMHTVAGLPLMEARGITKGVLRLTERVTYFTATHVYPNSKGLAEYIYETIHPHGEKFRMIGNGSSNGIDTIYFSKTEELDNKSVIVRKQYGIGTDQTCFCFVGRLVRDKGIVELIEAFQQIRAFMNVKLMLVGNFEDELDPLPAATSDFIKSSDSVILTGFQRDIRPLMLASDVLVFPSYREGFPNVILQASCMGLPCIATDINGCNEIITDKFSGRLVKPKNAEQLHTAMMDFITNRKDWAVYAQRAKEFVFDNFDRKIFWDLLLKEYREQFNAHVRKHF
jgi:glycosyltransferase involved in cell wall biosynthesis